MKKKKKKTLLLVINWYVSVFSQVAERVNTQDLRKLEKNQENLKTLQNYCLVFSLSLEMKILSEQPKLLKNKN